MTPVAAGNYRISASGPTVIFIVPRASVQAGAKFTDAR